MDCAPAQKERYGTHMMSEEADDWWLECRQRLLNTDEEITWAVFSREFLRKCFPEDVRGKKEIELLEPKQGNMSVTKYAAKFSKLAKFYPQYADANAEFSKCIKFENGLRPDFKKAIGYRKIRVFADLVDSCRIFEEDSNAHYKVMKDQRGKSQSRSAPYTSPTGRGRQRAAGGQRISGGDAPASIVCFKCGKFGHKGNVCRMGTQMCYRCGKEGHMAADCECKEVICFNCGVV